MKLWFTLVAILATACASPAPASGPAVELPSAAAEANKDVVRRFYAAINRGAWEELNALVGPGFVHRTPDSQTDLPRFKEGASRVRSAVPDYDISVEDAIAEGDRVAVRLAGRGTHQGSFYGEEPTGQPIIAHGMMIHRLEDGRIVEIWELSDLHPPLEVLGAVPRGADATAPRQSGDPILVTSSPR